MTGGGVGVEQKNKIRSLKGGGVGLIHGTMQVDKIGQL